VAGSFGGHADAAAKASDKGAAVGGEALFDGITVYQLTKSGLALQGTVKGNQVPEGRRIELTAFWWLSFSSPYPLPPP
jgi:hypothetical protein